MQKLIKPEDLAKVESKRPKATHQQIEPKYDGIRLCLIRDDYGEYSAITRNRTADGEPNDIIEKLPHLKTSAVHPGTILDGELILREHTSSYGVSAITNSTITNAVDFQNRNGRLHFVAFDCLRFDGIDLRPRALCSRQIYIPQTNAYVHRIRAQTVQSAKQRQDLFDRYLRRGYEGIVVKHPNSSYGDKDAWIKMLPKINVDCRVESVSQGKGKYAGTAGSLELSVDTPDGRHIVVGRVNCGTDEERDMWWFRHQMNIARGCIVEVEALDWTPNKQLKFARYKGHREDKSLPNIVDFAQERPVIATQMTIASKKTRVRG